MITKITILEYINQTKTHHTLITFKKAINRRLMELNNFKSYNPFSSIPLETKIKICREAGLLV